MMIITDEGLCHDTKKFLNQGPSFYYPYTEHALNILWSISRPLYW